MVKQAKVQFQKSELVSRGWRRHQLKTVFQVTWTQRKSIFRPLSILEIFSLHFFKSNTEDSNWRKKDDSYMMIIMMMMMSDLNIYLPKKKKKDSTKRKKTIA